MPNVAEHTRSLWKNLINKNVILACSGGVDSMVLMHLLWSLKVDLSVVHVNYQLRGDASNQDAALVKSVCEQFDIPCEIRTINLKKTLENGGNLQDEARKVRYTWFQEILDDNPMNRLALAHHEDDQLETFFMNLARKSGVLGLACMKTEHNGIVRPLLDFSKNELLNYAKKNGVQWREDQSNASNAYTRNRLRNEFLPFLRDEIPNLNGSVSLLIDHFQATQIELEETVKPIVASIREAKTLSIETYAALSEWERIELLRQCGISASYADRILHLNKRGKQIEVNDSEFNSIVRDQNQFTFLCNQTREYELKLEEIDALPGVFSKEVAYLDADKIQGELELRRWQIGDRISPIGMNGSQLVSDIIKDAKITADKKQNQLVVHDEKSILWCVGLKISRKAIADDQSENILRCSVIFSTAEESELP